MPEEKKPLKGATLLEEEVAEQTKKVEPKPIGAVTLVLFSDLSCDVLAETNIEETIFRPTPQLLSFFGAFLEDVRQEMNVSQVLRKYVKQE